MLPGDYRRYAAECLKSAESTIESDDRARLIDTAQVWLQLARQAEKNSETVLVYETPEPRQHVVRQQQQPQTKIEKKE